MLFCIGVLTDSSHLPRNLHVGLVSPYAELVSFDLAGYYGLCKDLDDRQLVSEIAVQRLEIAREHDHGQAIRICSDVAVIDVHHVRRFYERMRQVLMRRIERMVDAEPACPLCDRPAHVQIASDVDSAFEVSCQTASEGGAPYRRTGPRIV